MTNGRPKLASACRSDERGFVLAIVLVFLFLVTMTAFTSAMMARTDVQIVNNIQNEKQAFFVAEAGITEAITRLEMTEGASTVTVNGRTFDPAIDPENNIGWSAKIILDSFNPVLSGNSQRTPTLQALDSTALPYSTTSHNDNDVLTIAWVENPAAPGEILRLQGAKVMKITSTGRPTDGSNARRTVTRLVGSENVGALVLDPTGCSAVRLQGGGTLEVPGSIHVNSNCASGGSAISVGGSAELTAEDRITTRGTSSGDVRGNEGTAPPETLVPGDPDDDPLSTLPYPASSGLTVRRGSAASVPTPYSPSSNATLEPGVYYGGMNISANNVRLNEGIYVMAGGGFRVSGGSVRGDRVMIFNTCSTWESTCPTSGNGEFDQFYFSSGSSTITVNPPTSGTYAGIVFFQDRRFGVPDYPPTGSNIHFQATPNGRIDGLIYAPTATFSTTGSLEDTLYVQLLVYRIDMQGGGEIGEPTNWVDFGRGLQKFAWGDY